MVWAAAAAGGPLSIMILGGGPPPSLDQPLPFVAPRLDRAWDLYNSHPGSAVICLSAGTFHTPNLHHCGRPVVESYPCALHMARLGVQPKDLHVDTMSLDTLGNAWWGIGLVESRGLPEDVAVITSDFHMPRSYFAYEWAVDGKGMRLVEAKVEDVGIDADGLRGRKEREARSLDMYREKRAEYQNLDDYMFLEHGLYSGKGVVDRMEGEAEGCGSIDAATLRSYGGQGKGWEEMQPRFWRELAAAGMGFLAGFLLIQRKGGGRKIV